MKAAVMATLLVSSTALAKKPVTVVIEDARGPAHTDELSPRVHIEHVPVPLSNNFRRGEYVLIGLTAVGNLSLALFRDQATDLRWGAPLIGAPPGFDVDVSRALSRPVGGFLKVVDEIGGIGVPVAAGAFYALDGVVTAVRGRGMTGDVYSVHHFFAFAEAYLLNLTLTQVAKYGIGRERPRYALGSVPPDDDDNRYLSFYSGHTSSAFCAGSYLYRDLTDYLVAERGAGVFVGRVLPGVAIYGFASLIGYQRIANEKHYLTDVVAGAAVGSLIGHLIYALHFDTSGHPRHRRGHKVEVVIGPGSAGIMGSF
jgi:membrane-associated phospholipid phosphatase